MIAERKTAQQRAVEKYDRENTVQLHLKLNKKTDADILDYLDGLSNKQGFIKTLIRNAIEKG